MDDQEYEKLKISAYHIIKVSKDVEQVKQALAFILPIAHEMDINETAKVLGFSSNWVSQLRSRFLKGEPLKHASRGGRRHEVMSAEQELKFVEIFRAKYPIYQDIDAKLLKDVLEDYLGKEISTSYVYGFIKRNINHLNPDDQ